MYLSASTSCLHREAGAQKLLISVLVLGSAVFQQVDRWSRNSGSYRGPPVCQSRRHRAELQGCFSVLCVVTRASTRSTVCRRVCSTSPCPRWNRCLAILLLLLKRHQSLFTLMPYGIFHKISLNIQVFSPRLFTDTSLSGCQAWTMGISTKVPPLMGLCSQVGTVCRELGAQCQGLRGGEPVAGTGMHAFVSPQTPLVPHCLQCFDYATSFKPPGLSSYCFLPWNVLPFFCFMNAFFLPYSFFPLIEFISFSQVV